MRHNLTKAIASAVTLILIFAFLVSCDDDDGECNFDFDDILNGSTRPSQTSEWDCVGDGEVFSVAFFENETGFDSDLGVFTWEKNGCRSLVFFQVLAWEKYLTSKVQLIQALSVLLRL